MLDKRDSYRLNHFFSADPAATFLEASSLVCHLSASTAALSLAPPPTVSNAFLVYDLQIIP